jgi:hypothetical protein
MAQHSFHRITAAQVGFGGNAASVIENYWVRTDMTGTQWAWMSEFDDPQVFRSPFSSEEDALRNAEIKTAGDHAEDCGCSVNAYKKRS